MPQPSVFKGVQDFPLPAFKPLIPSAGLSKATLAASRRPFQGNSRPQEPVPVIHRFSWTFCSGTCHLLFLHGFPACFKPFRRPFQGNSRSYRPHRGNSRSYRSQTLLQTSAGLSKATLTATGPSHLFLRAFNCHLPAFKLLQAPAICFYGPNPSNPPTSLSKATLAASHKHFQGNSCSYMPQTMLQTLPQAFPQQLSQLQAPAICF